MVFDIFEDRNIDTVVDFKIIIFAIEYEFATIHHPHFVAHRFSGLFTVIRRRKQKTEPQRNTTTTENTGEDRVLTLIPSSSISSMGTTRLAITLLILFTSSGVLSDVGLFELQANRDKRVMAIRNRRI